MNVYVNEPFLERAWPLLSQCDTDKSPLLIHLTNYNIVLWQRNLNSCLVFKISFRYMSLFFEILTWIFGIWICYDRVFMSHLYKSKRYNPINMLNYTSRYLDNIFTIVNPKFWNISKRTSAEQSSYLWQSNVFAGFTYTHKSYWQWLHTIVYNKNDDFGFSIVDFPWWSGDVLRLKTHGINISQLIMFARCHHSKTIDTMLPISQASKKFGLFFRSSLPFSLLLFLTNNDPCAAVMFVCYYDYWYLELTNVSDNNSDRVVTQRPQAWKFRRQ